jgi:hypothetical protein
MSMMMNAVCRRWSGASTARVRTGRNGVIEGWKEYLLTFISHFQYWSDDGETNDD